MNTSSHLPRSASTRSMQKEDASKSIEMSEGPSGIPHSSGVWLPDISRSQVTIRSGFLCLERFTFRSSALVHKWITFFASMEASDESVFTGSAAPPR